MATIVNENAAGGEEHDDFDDEFAKAIAASDAPAPKKEEPKVVVATEETAEAKTAREATEAKAAEDAKAKETADKAAADAAAKLAAETTEEKAAREKTEKDAADAKKTADDEKAAAAALAASPAVIAATTARALVEETRKAQAADAKVAADAAKATADAAAEAAKHELTDAEKAELNKLEGDWADVIRIFELKSKAERGFVSTATGKAMKAMVDHIEAQVAPIAETTQALQEQRHFEDIRAKHPDFDAVHAKLEPWIKLQPAYLQKTYNEVYTGGTAEEVVDLVQRFKDANGIVAPKPSDETHTPPKQKPAVDQKKIDALAPVGSQRSTVQDKGADKNDFDAGFDEALALLGTKK